MAKVSLGGFGGLAANVARCQIIEQKFVQKGFRFVDSGCGQVSVGIEKIWCIYAISEIRMRGGYDGEEQCTVLIGLGVGHLSSRQTMVVIYDNTRKDFFRFEIVVPETVGFQEPQNDARLLCDVNCVPSSGRPIWLQNLIRAVYQIYNPLKQPEQIRRAEIDGVLDAVVESLCASRA